MFFELNYVRIIEMRKYELVLVLNSSLSDAQRKKIVESIKELAKTAKITKEDDWGQKPLSYPINKELLGHYLDLNLESEEAISPDLEKRLITQEGLLRHLLLRHE